MPRQVQPGPRARERAGLPELLDQTGEDRPVQCRGGQAAKLLGVGSEVLGGALVLGGEGIEDSLLQAVPARAGQRHAHSRRVDAHGVERAEEAFQLLRPQVPGEGKTVEIDGLCRRLEHARERRHRVVAVQGAQQGEALRGPAPPRRGERVEHPAAPDRPRGRLVAQDETVAVQGPDGTVEDQLHGCLVARLELLPVEKREPAGHVLGRQVDVHGGPVLDRFRFGGQEPHAPVETRARGVEGGVEHPLAPADRLALDPGEVQRAALSRPALVGRPVLGVNAAHADRGTCGGDGQPVAHAHDAREHRAGDDGARAGQREGAVDGEAEPPPGLPRRSGCHRRLEVAAQDLDPFAGASGDGKDGAAGKSGTGE